MHRAAPFLMTFTGALALGLALASVHSAKGAESPPKAPPPLSLSSVQQDLEKLTGKVDAIRADVESLKEQVRGLRVTQTGGGGGYGGGGGGGKTEKLLKELQQKLEELTRAFEGHTHEYLIEAVTSDGGTVQMQPGQIMGTGAQPTGRIILGKPIQK